MIILHPPLLSLSSPTLGVSDWASLIMGLERNALVHLSLVLLITLYRYRDFLLTTLARTRNLVDSLSRMHPLCLTTLISTAITVPILIFPGSAVLVRIDDRR
jgi:hypothetical protein